MSGSCVLFFFYNDISLPSRWPHLNYIFSYSVFIRPHSEVWWIRTSMYEFWRDSNSIHNIYYIEKYRQNNFANTYLPIHILVKLKHFFRLCFMFLLLREPNLIGATEDKLYVYFHAIIFIFITCKGTHKQHATWSYILRNYYTWFHTLCVLLLGFLTVKTYSPNSLSYYIISYYKNMQQYIHLWLY